MQLIARNSREIGAAVRRNRRKLNLTQNEMAARMGSRQATISSLENGQPASVSTLIDALAALDLEMVIRPRSKKPLEKILEDSF
jgi:HTH-type transcriptional regulator/antitoxin HipB